MLLASFPQWIAVFSFILLYHKKWSYILYIFNLSFLWMKQQVLYFMRKTFVKNLLFEQFLTFTDKSNMILQTIQSKKAEVTKMTFEWSFSFMNWCNLCMKWIITKISFKWLLLIMHKSNIIFYVIFDRELAKPVL